MYYEINVAIMINKKGWDGNPEYTHLFATSNRSITDENTLKKVYRVFKEKFPSPQYQLSVTHYKTIGENVDVEKYDVGIAIEKLEKGYYLFGNRGACYSGEIHIGKSGKSTTLCDTPMLSSNYAKTDDTAGCKECIKIYKEQTNA